MVNSCSSGLLDALLPHYCALCGFRSLRSMALCMGCENDLKPNRSACYQCGIPLRVQAPVVAGLQSDNAGDNHRRCGACLSHPPPFDRVVAPWLYDECMAHLIQRWKFRRERALTPLLYNLWRSHNLDPIDAHLIVPVPLHWARRLRRGFNQAELLAQRIHADTSKSKRAALDRSLLRRNRATTAQTSINALERRNNLIDAFTVRKRCDNLRIALIDDVVTTGATVAAVTNALKDAGAAEVHVYCLARTPSPGG
ncbi:MAG: double zinc ribbon domain-containing protein [Halioglobus sp.]